MTGARKPVDIFLKTTLSDKRLIMEFAPQPNRRFSIVYAAALLSAAACWQGCAPMKTVTINSTPQQAQLTLYRVNAAGDETPLTPEPVQTETPAVIPLNFANQVHYRVEAHRALCLPSLDTVINNDPQSSYNITLTQYKQYVSAIVNTPTRAGDIWQLKPIPVQTVATLDAVEPQLVYIDQPQQVTSNKNPDIDFPSFTTSPTAGVMVYEQITPDSSTPTGYASKLYKLPLDGGENPTLLTLGRKQQRFPAFDFSGDYVIFDSNDDSRSDAPFSFKTVENEASISHLDHDSDTLEYSFSVAKDNVAFTAYGPNSTEPQIEAAGRDGSGPTERAIGQSPQLSPDGSTILYIHRPENGGKFRISTVNTRGPIETREIVQNDDVDYFDPHWSPDGKLIVFTTPSRGKDLPDDVKKEPNVKYHDAESEHSFLWLMTADGQHSIRLTRNESFDSNPVFDRSGRTIYFRSNRGGVWNIWKLDLTDAAFAELKVTPPAQ
jgi:Tol biopolymer transport system component